MKKNAIRISLTLWLTMAVIYMACGQQQSLLQEIETVHLSADRSLYLAGEQLQFSACLTLNEQNQLLSRILYVEIISPEVKSISSGKFMVQNSAAFGELTIPADIVSGVYYLRAYTKYMRNAGPEAYAWVAIKIVNPRLEGVLSGTGSDTLTPELSVNTNPVFFIGLEKDTFSPRNQVSVTLAPASASASDIKIIGLSVVPASASVEYHLPRFLGSRIPDSLLFYPESRGLSITGEIKEVNSGKPVAGSRVSISIIGKGREFMVQETGSSGRFFIPLPAYTGTRDLFLCTGNTGDYNAKVLVDNDFCTQPVRLAGSVFRLSPEERVLAYNMALNCQIRKHFLADSTEPDSTTENEEVAFYGKPDYTLQLEDYVQLPTLGEYFNELPGMVKIRKKNGKKYFKVIGTQSEMNFFDPLVMIDWVAVEDAEKILAASPANIARIEMINQPYVKGDVIYGGIVSIVSKRGDFAGIDLPSSGIFVSFQFLAETGLVQQLPSAKEHIPDTRNTIFWQPDLSVKAGNPYSFSFTTPDTPGKYAISLKGITHDGLPYRQVKEFTVTGND